MKLSRLDKQVLLIGVILFFGVISIAAVTNTPVFVQLPKPMVAVLPTTGSTTPVALGPTPGANGTKCVAMVGTNTSTNPYTVQIGLLRGGTAYMQSTTLVPASSGNLAANVPVNLMSATVWPGLPIDSDGNPFFYLQTGDQLQINSTAAMADPNKVIVTAQCGDF